MNHCQSNNYLVGTVIKICILSSWRKVQTSPCKTGVNRIQVFHGLVRLINCMYICFVCMFLTLFIVVPNAPHQFTFIFLVLSGLYGKCRTTKSHLMTSVFIHIKPNLFLFFCLLFKPVSHGTLMCMLNHFTGGAMTAPAELVVELQIEPKSVRLPNPILHSQRSLPLLTWKDVYIKLDVEILLSSQKIPAVMRISQQKTMMIVTMAVQKRKTKRWLRSRSLREKKRKCRSPG